MLVTELTSPGRLPAPAWLLLSLGLLEIILTVRASVKMCFVTVAAVELLTAIVGWSTAPFIVAVVLIVPRRVRTLTLAVGLSTTTTSTPFSSMTAV